MHIATKNKIYVTKENHSGDSKQVYINSKKENRTGYLMVYSIKLVVETHCEICACVWCHMCCERALDLINCVVHVNSSLANLHVLKA